MKFELPKELGDKILNYLATKPWIEVNDIIVDLQNLKIINNINNKEGVINKNKQNGRTK